MAKTTNGPLSQLLALQDKVVQVRDAVFACAYALDHGKTDLELRTAGVLQRACDELDEVTDEMSAVAVEQRTKRSALQAREVRP